jgi:hypothetical protein
VHFHEKQKDIPNPDICGFAVPALGVQSPTKTTRKFES